MCAQHYKYILFDAMIKKLYVCRAIGSNHQMVRPSSMSVVKLLIICVQSTWQNFGATFLAVRRRSHCTSASNWELPLLCSPALQGTSSLIKSWENTYDFLQHPFLHHIAMSYTMHVGWKDLRAIFFWPNIFFWKENNTSWWGSPGRSAGKFSHTECRSYAIALT